MINKEFVKGIESFLDDRVNDKTMAAYRKKIYTFCIHESI